MKTFGIIVCVILFIIPLLVYGGAIVNAVQMGANCINYLEMAADANSVEIANKHLTSAITYLENNNLTSGSTQLLVYRPTNDIGLWYENLKSAQTQLIEANNDENLTRLEESNILMKLRETLLDEESITHPAMISFYPNHIGWFWALILSWLLWVVGGIGIYIICEDEKPKSYYSYRM